MSSSMPPQSREDFFAMLRSHIPKSVLETIEADPESKNVPAEVAAMLQADKESIGGFAAKQDSYSCANEDNVDASDPLALWIGYNGEIPRWKKGSVVNWAAMASGYPTPADAVYAAYKLWDAAKQWNALGAGVTFNWVTKLDDAAFVLRYGGDMGNTYARAFFPNTAVLNTVYVYKLSFRDDQRMYQTNIFLHELGHVLGLRHEFAGDRETGAVRFGSSNPKSVMSYEFPPTLQPSDVATVKEFYEYSGESSGGLKVADKEPDN